MERLTGLDASFLYFETPTMHMHVCATIIFDPSTVEGGYSFERVREVIESRLHLVAPFRRKLAAVPLNLHHPVWVEDENFDLDFHLHRIGLPSPGTMEQLGEITGDIASRQLDRSRPLWEMWIVEGLDNGNIALVAKMHHCTIDGVSGANLMVHLFDLDPNETKPPGPAWKPEKSPTDLELVGYGLMSRLRRPLNIFRVVPQTVQSVSSFITTRRGREGPGMAAPFTAPRTLFNNAITAHRQVAYTRVALDDIKTVKNAFGTTVNDVVLAVTSGALRRYLEKHEEIPDKSLIATCPVSVRPAASEDAGGTEAKESVGSNQVSAMFTSLASDLENPVERLRAIAASTKGAKEEHNAIGADMLQNWAEFAAPTTFSLAARAYSSLKLAERHPVVHNLVISNVPGPPIPLYFAGARLTALYPLGPIFDGAALNVTVMSYMDNVDFGFIACRETVPSLWDLAGFIPEALAELVKEAAAV
ncbi:MAG: wax ester/triacylglycerol synthase family O-acyltransferase [Actinobacteria bacterium]|nr:wax ester/triacylglycerol synthase family O-acyltransferase [Actinomycetota bacterium]